MLAPDEVPIHPEAADEAGLHPLLALWKMKACSPTGNSDSKGTEMTLQQASRDELLLVVSLLRPVDWKVGGVIDGEVVGAALEGLMVGEVDGNGREMSWLS